MYGTVQLTEFSLMLILNFLVAKWATYVINIMTGFAYIGSNLSNKTTKRATNHCNFKSCLENIQANSTLQKI